MEINSSVLNDADMRFTKQSIIDASEDDKEQDFRVELVEFINDSSYENDDKFFFDMLPNMRFYDYDNPQQLASSVAYTKPDTRTYFNAPSGGKAGVGKDLRIWEFIYDHECLHQLWDTFGVADEIKKQNIPFDHVILNIASDCVINEYLRDKREKKPFKDGIFPESLEKHFGVTYDPKYDTQFTLYVKLVEHMDEIKKDPKYQKEIDELNKKIKPKSINKSEESGGGGGISQKHSEDYIKGYTDAIKDTLNKKVDPRTYKPKSGGDYEKGYNDAIKEIKNGLEKGLTMSDSDSGSGSNGDLPNIPWDTDEKSSSSSSSESNDNKSSESAQDAADRAQDAADKAQDAADKAKQEASDAAKNGDSSASEKQDAADKAQDAADKAKQAANRAKDAAEKAEDAKSNGNSAAESSATKDAQKAADDAEAAANSAKDAAEGKKSDESRGQIASKGAQDSAKAAQEAAEKAEKAAKDGSSKEKKAAKNAAKAAQEAKEAAEKAEEAAKKYDEAIAKGNKSAADKALKEAKEAAEKAEEASREAINAANEAGAESEIDKSIPDKDDPNYKPTKHSPHDKFRGIKPGPESPADLEKIKKQTQAILDEYKNKLSGDFGTFIKKCSMSKKLNRSGLQVGAPKAQRGWDQKMYEVASNFIKVKIFQKKRMFKHTYQRVKRGSGPVKMGQPIAAGKKLRDEKLPITIALYIDRSGSMSGIINNVWDACYTMCESFKKIFGKDKVVEKVSFKIYAFDDYMQEIKYGNRCGARGGNMSFSDMLKFITQHTNDYLINVFITDGYFDMDENEIKKFLDDEINGMVTYIANNDEGKVIKKISNNPKYSTKLKYILADSQFKLTK